jgi:hypothetical protein
MFLQRAIGAREVPMSTICRLLITLLFALLVVGCHRVPETPEEKAVAAFEEVGGKVICDSDGHVTQLYVSGSQVTDKVFEQVRHFAHLTHVDMVGTALTDASIEHLTDIPNLRSVDLSFSQITAKGAQLLRRKCRKCRVTYASPKRYEYEKDLE